MGCLLIQTQPKGLYISWHYISNASFLQKAIWITKTKTSMSWTKTSRSKETTASRTKNKPTRSKHTAHTQTIAVKTKHPYFEHRSNEHICDLKTPQKNQKNAKHASHNSPPQVPSVALLWRWTSPTWPFSSADGLPNQSVERLSLKPRPCHRKTKSFDPETHWPSTSVPQFTGHQRPWKGPTLEANALPANNERTKHQGTKVLLWGMTSDVFSKTCRALNRWDHPWHI